ncbi:hypothetical protein COO91_05640 [Nostoc flagelliforme CCNUN1]|uniref:Uncharacterized protein n=1 Tax=Nostoc flagelliforme CCNUN1 TaxID=2038116 RepID=A0A2K8SW26_9NOSO|nr:hypothetical protein COO91_05640 [Nostoc flagelliforme CCNUN1]
MVVLVILANVCVCSTFLGSKNYDEFWNFCVLRIEGQNIG